MDVRCGLMGESVYRTVFHDLNMDRDTRRRGKLYDYQKQLEEERVACRFIWWISLMRWSFLSMDCGYG